MPDTDVTPWRPPTGDDARSVACGVDWDAVRAPAHLARPAREMLGEASGATIRDPYRGDLYWRRTQRSMSRIAVGRRREQRQHHARLPVGAVDSWAPLPDVTTYGTACFIWVPPRGRTGGPGPYWLADPDDGRLLTHPTALHGALSEAIAERYPADAAERLGVRP